MSHYPPITPHLAIDDIAAALEFYPRAFGATERLRLSLPDGSIAHAELELNGALVTLGAAIPAYGLVASAVGLLVYLYVFNQLLLFGAAWAATSPHGRVVDLSADDKTAPVGQNTWIRHTDPR